MAVFFSHPNLIPIYLFEDAHEFLNFLINHINEIIVGEQGGAGTKAKTGEPETEPQNSPTWINEIFQVCYVETCTLVNI